MLGTIVCDQLLVSELITIFCVGDHPSNHGGCEWLQETKWACFLALFDPTDNQSRQSEKHAHFDALDHTPSIFQECRDYHRQKMSWPSEWSRVGCLKKCHQVCDWPTNYLSLISDYLSCVLELIRFVSDMSDDDWNSGIWLFSARKKTWLCLCRHFFLNISNELSYHGYVHCLH